ncbi:hypothetical protein SDC9_103467 [bioreactor metagenome]|uniref:Uncharacterized protein n=1 Tax=bioreactor metagenome TaxID=1076179 RepID=A0A645AV61_9ZZZZ
MANTIQVKLMIPKGLVDEIDELVTLEKSASRAAFGMEAVVFYLNYLRQQEIQLAQARSGQVPETEEKAKTTS